MPYGKHKGIAMANKLKTIKNNNRMKKVNAEFSHDVMCTCPYCGEDMDIIDGELGLTRTTGR